MWSKHACWTALLLALSTSQAQAELSALRGFQAGLNQDDNCHFQYTSAEACDADPACAWCECSAIPSACYSLKAVKTLPEGVFHCHKQEDTASVTQIMADFLEDSPDWDKIKNLQCLLKQQDSTDCFSDASLECAWCELAQPQQGIDHSCIPAFAEEKMNEQGVVTTCVDEKPSVEAESPDWSKFKDLMCLLKQSDSTTCLQDKSLDCAWCELAQPQGDVDHGCFPGFLTAQMMEQETLKSCAPETSFVGDEDLIKCWEQSSHDGCVNVDCSWCTLVTPIAGIENVCQPSSYADAMVHSGIASQCSAKTAAEEMTEVTDLATKVGLAVENDSNWLQCWSSEEESTCVGNKEAQTGCSWCTLTTPVAGVTNVCEPQAFVDSLVKGGVCSACESTPEADDDSDFVSERTQMTFQYEEGLVHTLEDNTVDPQFCDPKSPKSLSGYVSLDGSQYDGPGEDKHYFYWFFESRDSEADENTPFFIWLTGGPGCSSSLALLSENGPCSVKPDGTGTTPNEYSWNSNAHALWLDQPTGVGYSYGKIDDHSEDMVGENAYYFLQSFLQSHPEYAKNPLFITGESYAGHYVPAITHRIWQGNNEKLDGTIHLNLQGMAIGNGLTNPEVQYPQYPEMAFHNSHSIQVIDAKTYTNMKKEADGCTTLIRKCNSINKDKPGPMEIFFCQSAVAVCNMAFMVPYQMTGLNPYDIREECKVPPLCYDFSQVSDFLNSPSTKKALHVKETSKWESCNFGVHSNFMNDWMKDMSPRVKDVLNAGIRVLVYAGDVDFICNYLGNRAWTLALDWDHATEFNAAADHEWNNKTGLAKSANGFTFLQVYDAGHMVPMNQPKVALDMVNQFFSGDEF